MNSTKMLTVVSGPTDSDTQSFSVLQATLILRRNLIIALLVYPIVLGGILYLWLPEIAQYSLNKVLSPGTNQKLIDTISQVQNRANILVTVLPYLPILVGMLVGAPLFSRQFENGTYKFDWTQGAGRFRLLRSDLVVILGISGLGAFVIGSVYQHLWRQPLVLATNGVSSSFDSANWLSGQIFLQPALYAAGTIFFVVISMVIGTLIKRVLGAIVCALVLLVTVAVAFQPLYAQSRTVNVHTVTTNDPLEINPETQAKLLSHGFSPTKHGDFEVKRGWLNANGTLSPVQTDPFLKLDTNGYAQVDPATGNLLFESGARYKAIVKKIGKPYVIWWRAPSDYPFWVAGWSIAMLLLSALLGGLIKLRIGRKS